jgi:hypothetical protein
MSNLYPFTTRKQIQAKLASDPEYRKSVIVMLWEKQTEHEQATKTTLNRNKVGFMSSHAVRGTELAQKIKAGEELTEEEVSRVDAIAPRYSRQVACFMRAAAIKDNPALAEVARTFSADKNLSEGTDSEEAAEIVEDLFSDEV